MDRNAPFEAVWPDLLPRLARYVRHLGVPAADREDVLQETAIRLYRNWHAIDQQRSVEAYARVVAANAWRDVLRRRSDREVLGDVPDRAVGTSVEELAEARLEISRVGRALARLNRSHRQALLSSVAEDSVATTDAVRMARMRARRRLLTILETASAGVLIVGRAVGRRSVARPVVTAAAVGTLIVAGMGSPGSAVLHTLFPSTSPVRPPTVGALPAAADSATRPLASVWSGIALGAVGPAAARHAAWQPLRVDMGPAHAELLLRMELLGVGVGVYDRDGPPVCVHGLPHRELLRRFECRSWTPGNAIRLFS